MDIRMLEQEAAECALREHKELARRLLTNLVQDANEERRTRRAACPELAQTQSEVMDVAQQASTQIAVRDSRLQEASVAMEHW